MARQYTRGFRIFIRFIYDHRHQNSTYSQAIFSGVEHTPGHCRNTGGTLSQFQLFTPDAIWISWRRPILCLIRFSYHGYTVTHKGPSALFHQFLYEKGFKNFSGVFCQLAFLIFYTAFILEGQLWSELLPKQPILVLFIYSKLVICNKTTWKVIFAESFLVYRNWRTILYSMAICYLFN